MMTGVVAWIGGGGYKDLKKPGRVLKVVKITTTSSVVLG
jgi:hypothetical protein